MERVKKFGIWMTSKQALGQIGYNNQYVRTAYMARELFYEYIYMKQGKRLCLELER
jgi:hypothetical protein